MAAQDRRSPARLIAPAGAEAEGRQRSSSAANWHVSALLAQFAHHFPHIAAHVIGFLADYFVALLAAPAVATFPPGVSFATRYFTSSMTLS